MQGFNIISEDLHVPSLKNDILVEGYRIQNMMNSKFENDKLFVKTNEYVIILDGIILNKKELDIYQDWKTSIIILYKKLGDIFFSKLRGSYCGALYDIKKKKWIIFSDQLGSKFIFYYQNKSTFICSCQNGFIYDTLKANKIIYSLSSTGAQMLLTYGYTLEHYTLSNEVKRLKLGYYITFTFGRDIEEVQYYFLKNDDNKKLHIEECIEEVDRLFCSAVRKQFDKDLEYGYKHLVALSAGLDCRMTSFVAHELGYTNQLNYTFSQTDYWDEIVPKQMSTFLKHEWLFKALDNGMWLYDIDNITRFTGGNITYYTIAHTYSLFRYLNFDEVGLVHTGQIGDVTISTHSKKKHPFILGDGAYNKKNINYLEFTPNSNFANSEIGYFTYRYLGGTNYGLQIYYPFSETMSPFMDLDFFEFALSIPNDIRFNHKLYKKWILLKHKDAANFVWEKMRCKITEPCIKWKDKNIPICQIPNKIKNQFVKKDLDCKRYMNPLGYYMTTNKELSEYLMSYFKYESFITDKNTKRILQNVKYNNNALEINSALSLLAAIKLYFS